MWYFNLRIWNQKFINISVISDFSSAKVALGAEFRGTFDANTSPRFQQQINATSSRELPTNEVRTKVVEDDLRSCTLEVKQKAPLKVVPCSWQNPRRGIDGQKDQGSSKVIHPRKANYREEWSLKMRDSARKASDPRSKRKSTRGSFGLIYFPAFLTPSRGFTVTITLSYKIQDNCTQQRCSFNR